MGKGRILSGGTDGLYTIEILEDRTRAQTNRATAVARVASLDTRISELTTELSSAQGDVDTAAAAQDQAIADYQAALDDPQLDAEGARQAMVKAGEAVIQAAAKRDAIARNIAALKAERLSVQRRIDLIDALPPLRQISAWCADYVEDLSGEVATAEVPGEIGQVIIQPGYTDGAAWSPTDDGAIQPALSGTPAGVFYNLAMLPGWQKWRPTFRIATISNISNDLCDITLDAAISSQQGLDVNAQSSYSGVPIMYMDCNGDAFENGDKVLVAFSGNADQPMVVGFEKEPKDCGFDYSAALFMYSDSAPGTLYGWGWNEIPDQPASDIGQSNDPSAGEGRVGVAWQNYVVPASPYEEMKNADVGAASILARSRIELLSVQHHSAPTYTPYIETEEEKHFSLIVSTENSDDLYLKIKIYNKARVDGSFVFYDDIKSAILDYSVRDCQLSISHGTGEVSQGTYDSKNIGDKDVMFSRVSAYAFYDDIDTSEVSAYFNSFQSTPISYAVKRSRSDTYLIVGLRYISTLGHVTDTRPGSGNQLYDIPGQIGYITVKFDSDGVSSIVENLNGEPPLI